MTEVTSLISAIGTLCIGVGALLGFRASLRAARATHEEVRTMNGKTMGVLADLSEGRRIAAEIAPEDQTASEKHYVEAVELDKEPPSPPHATPPTPLPNP